MVNFKEDDVIFCTVKGLEGASVFLETEDGFPGSMVMSEVAAGRIRNLREYVSPNRKIVCKVLKVKPDHLELSLRRVTTKERDDVLDKYKKERALVKILETIGEKFEEVLEKIKQEYDVRDFVEEAREDIKLIEKFLSKENAKKLFGIISEKESSEKKVSKIFSLKSVSGEGVKEIREILDVETEIHYLGSGRFSILATGKDFKSANNHLIELLSEIEKRANKKKVFFEVGK